VTTPHIQWSALAPDLILLGGAAFLLLAAVAVQDRRARDLAMFIGMGCFIGSLVAVGVIWDYGGGAWSVLENQFVVDRFANLVRVIVAGSGLLTLMGAYGWSRLREHGPEFVAFLLVAAAGMDLLAASNSFISLFVTLETFSISLYALCAFETRSSASLEAGLKYLVLGSIGSAILLYGAAFLYGATGSFGFPDIAKGVADDPNSLLALTGTALVLAGLGFKIAVVPFHMWTPDVYEGSPTPVTAFMSAATKAAAFAALFRVLVQALPAMGDVWRPALAAASIVTMLFANIAALRQTNLKRILAYSSVGHAGYLLMAVVSGEAGAKALLFYLAVYAATSVGAFTVVAIRERETGEPATLESLRGWGFSRPVLGAALAIFLLSLGGFPPTAGFLAKFYLFAAAIDADYTYLAIVGVVSTVISLGYYLRIGLALYDRSRESSAMLAAAPGTAWGGICAVLAVAVIVWLGVYPPDVLDWAGAAASTLLAAP
jgi:NADH-quinone oxidoreductase subunit N